VKRTFFYILLNGDIQLLERPGFLLAAIFCILIFLTSPSLQAEPVSKEKAENAVLGWLKSNEKPLDAKLGSKIRNVETFTDEKGEAVYYVVNLEPDGFVVAAGEDHIEPIICFAEDGRFNPDDDNPLAALIKRDVPQRKAAVEKIGKAGWKNAGALNNNEKKIVEAGKIAGKKWATFADENSLIEPLGIGTVSDVRVEPFIMSTWGQANVQGYSNSPACYNYYTPPYGPGDSRNYPCGCVATAMSQLMRYHQHPASYNWINMPLKPDSSTPDAQRQTIGDLCFDAAEAADTTYGAGGSSASLMDADTAFKATFQYSNSILSNFPTLGSSLNNMINTNLDGSKPVILGVSGSGGGHGLICDGYGYNSGTLYHHLNLGWDGLSNAWYNLPTIDAYYSFDTIDNCVYNVFKTGTGEIISGRVTDISGNPVPEATVTATGGGTYQATTNSRGVYALVNLPSNRTYTLTAVKSPYTFTSRNASTSKSNDYFSTSGNVWGINFASQTAAPPITYSQNIQIISGNQTDIILGAADDGLPNPPALMEYIITSLPAKGTLADPQAGLIQAVPYILLNNGNIARYNSSPCFKGNVSIEFKASDYGTPPSGGESAAAVINMDVNNILNKTYAPTDNLLSALPLKTGYQQSRTQVIYLASDVGRSMIITDIAINMNTVPGQDLNNWTIRMRHTSRNSYSASPYYETSGWTFVYQGNEPASPAGWRNFHFNTPFVYNGTSNLMVDFSFNNSYSTTDGSCKVSNTGVNRVVNSYANGTHGDPLGWSDANSPTIFLSKSVMNFKIIGLTAEQITGDFEPDCDIDLFDFAILANSWLTFSGESGFNPACDISSPSDGVINESDLEVFCTSWLEKY